MIKSVLFTLFFSSFLELFGVKEGKKNSIVDGKSRFFVSDVDAIFEKFDNVNEKFNKLINIAALRGGAKPEFLILVILTYGTGYSNAVGDTSFCTIHRIDKFFNFYPISSLPSKRI